MIHAFIPDQLLIPYKEVLPTLTAEDWSKSKQPQIWCKDRIDGEMMYKIHRHSSRIVDETGLSIQNQIYDVVGDHETIFPYYYQIIKINGEFTTPELLEGMEYQTITFLNGEYENTTHIISKDSFHSLSTQEDIFAFAIMWSKNVNPNTPKWFIRPYYRLFA